MKSDETRILACVSPSPSSRRLIRIASQLASSSHAAFAAVSVMERRYRRDQFDNRRQCIENLNYAKQLGAETEVLSGHGLARRLAAYAKAWGATKLVLGRSIPQKRASFKNQFLLRDLKRLLPDVEIITVPNPLPSYESEKENVKRQPLSLRDMGISLGIVAATTLLCWWFDQLGFTDATLITVYILAVLLISFFTHGYLCGAVFSLLNVMTFNYLFTVPLFSLKSYGTGYPVTLVVMFLAAFLTSSLTVQVKRQAQQHAQNAYRTEMLLGANRKLQRATNEDEILRAAAEQIQRLLLRSVLLYPVRNHALAEPLLVPAGETEASLKAAANRPNERKIAEWVIKNNIQCGATTGIFNDAAFWYLAVRMNEGDAACAVAGIRMGKEEWIDSFDKNLLLAMLGECAVALEKERLNRAGEEYILQIKQEQIRSNLLRSISHDLRTPLTTISGNANMLMSGAVCSEKDKQQIYTDIYDDSIWLIDLVENLLSITRIDGGALNIHKQPQDLTDILDAAAAHMQPRLKDHTLRVAKVTDLMIVNGDSALLVQLLDNLIENAFKYAGEKSAVEISARRKGENAILCVADNGPGIPDAEKEKIFEMFYTTQNHGPADDRRGLGLGLSLCKIIVQEHHGSIRVYDREPHGAVFEITLPLLED